MDANLPSVSDAARRHVERFNDAVGTGRWAAFAAGFTEDATMRFTNVPVGPFRGRGAILQGYVDQPPDDTMIAESIEELDAATALVHFRWNSGGSGTMQLRWQGGLVAELEIAFR